MDDIILFEMFFFSSMFLLSGKHLSRHRRLWTKKEKQKDSIAEYQTSVLLLSTTLKPLFDLNSLACTIYQVIVQAREVKRNANK